ncbi:MAG: hypothetical protein IJK84_04650 [Bacteroidales bacterium]|nr:hypothetical protein [Bacteroidales bacterium]
MKDFEKKLQHYGEELKNARCPYSDAELDRVIRQVVWNTPLEERHTIKKDTQAVACRSLRGSSGHRGGHYSCATPRAV